MTYTGHCLDNNALAANQLGVPGVPGWGSVQVPSGLLRGVVVLLHGLAVDYITPPLIPTDVGGFLPEYVGTLAADLLADGWVVIYPTYAEDAYSAGTPLAGLYADITNDTGHGARYLDTTLLWWRHVLDWVTLNHPGFPVLPIGISEGGWHALQIAGQRSSTIVGAVAHIPATIWSNVNPLVTPPFTFSGVNTTGMDAGTTALNACTAPTMVSYHTDDIAVGYDLAGTGGTPVSNTDIIITNGQGAGQPITRQSGTGNHALTLADVTAITGWVTSTIDPLCPAVR